MAKRTQSLYFEELDQASRTYLLEARERKGRGMPGLFLPTENYLPIAGFIVGLLVLIVMFIIAFTQIEHEPLGVAMLQTIGLLVGGWMIAAAIRVWVASKGDNYAGHFIYADGETLWECKGSTVIATDLYELAEAAGESQYSKEGKYQHTSVTVYMTKGKHKLKLTNEKNAERLSIFLNTLVWLRKGADSENGGADPSDLPPALLAGIARENAVEDYLPKKWTADALDIDIEEIPIPKRKNPPFLGLIPIVIIIVSGVLSIFLFKSLNVGWRDNAIWSNISDIRNQDARAGWLRAYLLDARNTRHRDEARKMLRDIYAQNMTRIRNSGAVDKDLADGLEVVMLSLAELPLPDVSIGVKDKTGGANAAAREQQFMKKYAQVIFEGVGGEDNNKNLLIRVAQAPDGAAGMIDVAWEYARVNNALQVNFTFTFRKRTDDAVVKTVRRPVAVNDQSPAALESIATMLGQQTAGPKKPPPPVEVETD